MKKLSEAEFEIMQVLWRHHAPMTSNQLLAEMGDGRNWKLASLMTVLARMAEKGAVYCDRSTRTNYYTALVSEEEYKLAEGRASWRSCSISRRRTLSPPCIRERKCPQRMCRS